MKPFNSNIGVRFVLNYNMPHFSGGGTQPKLAFQVIQLVCRADPDHLYAAIVQIPGPAAHPQVASGPLGENPVAHTLNPPTN